MYFVPCLECGGRGFNFGTNNVGKTFVKRVPCINCCGEGRIEVSQYEYNEFYKNQNSIQ